MMVQGRVNDGETSFTNINVSNAEIAAAVEIESNQKSGVIH
jgi:hypothetical protein